MMLFTTAFPFPYPFPALVYACMNKYPSPLAPHVISIDVLERTILEDGTIRSERLLGVQQDSPRWVNRVRRSQGWCSADKRSCWDRRTSLMFGRCPLWSPPASRIRPQRRRGRTI